MTKETAVGISELNHKYPKGSIVTSNDLIISHKLRYVLEIKEEQHLKSLDAYWVLQLLPHISFGTDIFIYGWGRRYIVSMGQ